MRFSLRLLVMAFFFLTSVAYSQKGQIKIETRIPQTNVVPGEMMTLYLQGTGETTFSPPSINDFRVVVRQNGIDYPSIVRSSATIPMGSKTTPTSNAPASSSKENAATEAYQRLLFTVPQGLKEGDATAVVIFRDLLNDEFHFKVVRQPAEPRIFQPLMTNGFYPTAVQRKQPGKPPTVLVFVRGQEKTINISPLIDPDTPDSAVLVTFKQGELKREVLAKITRRNPNDKSQPQVLTLATVEYKITVITPSELVSGDAQLEIRLKANGVVSEPGLMKIKIFG